MSNSEECRVRVVREKEFQMLLATSDKSLKLEALKYSAEISKTELRTIKKYLWWLL